MPRGPSWQPRDRVYAKCFSLSVLMTDQPAREASPRAGTVLIRSLRQREHRQVATECGVVAERCVAADGAKTRGRIGQTGRKPDAGPAAEAGQHRHIPLAALLVGRDVADDAGRGLELVEFLARLGVDRLEIALERAVEHHAA